ncbi:hypothetical protein N7519_005494 [Penicillium mononematosum]|uniref:uncharacterized protein n=1 Tax=Penicillium mononematosum TaxID=268346 RepID=UPI00254967E1|nr:uncharacterized protein N7519_005494 [Penicillium mononematosum]KAJ6184193.1 hypothetical protein N7519_005494 [Penicillium mononematosum]
MSMTSLSSNSYSPFPSQAGRMTQSQTPGLDTLAEGSQYALEQLQLAREADTADIPTDPGHSLDSKTSQHSQHLLYKEQKGSNSGLKDPELRNSLAEARSAIRKNSSATPARRRISRACDQCNQLRTKCDGHNPCAHCVEFGLSCEYARERKKRGKASKKDIAATGITDSDMGGSENTAHAKGRPSNGQSLRESNEHYDRAFDAARTLTERAQSRSHNAEVAGLSAMRQNQAPVQAPSQQQMSSSIAGISFNNYAALQEPHRPSMSVPDMRSIQMMQNSNGNPRSPGSMLHPQGFGSGYNDGAYPLMNAQDPNPSSMNHFRIGNTTENPSTSFMGFSPPAQSPSWLPLPSPSPANFPSFSMPPFSSSLRYPVLQPVLSHIISIIPQSLACDLLDVYFTSSSSSHLSPSSPYVVGYVFRKQSFLHPTKPRACTPGLLASMLWVGAQTSEAAFLTSPPFSSRPTTVVSASEYKAANGEMEGEGDMDVNGNKRQPSSLLGHGPGNSAINLTEEEREERRRIWWLLYATDRHLALCYNRPLTLLDKECEGLLQPMNDDIWQAGDFSSVNYRRAGPSSECTGHSMFGYFLPLMSILGEIVDLQHARNHPRFGLHFRNSGEWESQAMEIRRQLDVYAQSLKEFEARYTSSIALGTGDADTAMEGSNINHVSPSGRSSSTVGSHVSESIVHTRMVVAYGTHIMHVLHVLLAGKWDPINLLDDNDLWISSESFITAMGHAVSSAEAASDILEYDPDLSFMPFFFGIYLLQGSFLLLLTADKLQGDASPSVVRACETIVRAHEACVVTLNTEYQRTFRKVMRSALAQVRGRVPEDFGEQQSRRREVLGLYRWSGDGSGLAL